MKKKDYNSLKRIADVLLRFSPLIYTIMVSIAYVNVYFYYGLFGIQIENYVEVADILLIFLIPWLKYLILPVVIILGSIAVLFTKQTDDEDTTEKKGFNLFKKNPHLENVLIFVGFIVVLICFIFLQHILNKYFFKNWLLIILLISMTGFLVIKKYKTKQRQDKNLIFMIIFVIIFLAPSSYYFNKYYRLKNQIEYSEIEFKYDDQTIKTSKELIFVGQTSEYIFLHNLQTKKNQVFELKNISHFTIKTITNYTNMDSRKRKDHQSK